MYIGFVDLYDSEIKGSLLRAFNIVSDKEIIECLDKVRLEHMGFEYSPSYKMYLDDMYVGGFNIYYVDTKFSKHVWDLFAYLPKNALEYIKFRCL